MTVIKTSRRNIEKIGAIKAPESNIYSYENLLYYIDTKGIDRTYDEMNGTISRESYEFIKSLISETRYAHADYRTLYYAAGIYGVIGRYDEITLYDNEWDEIEHFNLKFC